MARATNPSTSLCVRREEQCSACLATEKQLASDLALEGWRVDCDGLQRCMKRAPYYRIFNAGFLGRNSAGLDG